MGQQQYAVQYPSPGIYEYDIWSPGTGITTSVTSTITELMPLIVLMMFMGLMSRMFKK